jgi:AAHS family 4-hydroxybenzoate transporter-like MFS transporter
MKTADDHVVDVGPLLDLAQWGPYQRWLVFLTALGIVFDGVDNQLVGVTLPTIVREWHVSRSAFAPVVSFGYLGMVIGGGLGGLVGDRIGRRSALIGSMLLFGVMTMAASAAGTVLMFGVLRCLAGFGLGGAIPNAAALAAEYVPLRDRPLAITLTVVCTPVGAVLAGLIAIPMLPALGWRPLFAVGGLLPVLAALALTRVLPESPRFLVRQPHRKAELVRTLRRMGHDVDDKAVFADPTHTTVEHASIQALFAGEFLRDTVALWIAFLSCLLTIYLSFTWVPSLLADAGFPSSIASAGIMVFNVGGIAGAVIGSMCIGRWGSRLSMPVMAALAAVSAGLMSWMPLSAAGSAASVLAVLALTGGLINSVQSNLFAMAAHVYPPALRATGVGSAAGFGRIGAIASGYVGVWALDTHGSASFFGVITGSLTICTLALIAIRRHIGEASVSSRHA